MLAFALWRMNKQNERNVVCSYSYGDSINLNDSSLNIVQWNVRGLIGKQDQVVRLIRAMGGSNKVHIICLNETWLRKETSSKVVISGYNLLHKCRIGKKGGGLSILISKDCTYREIDLSHLATIHTEELAIEVKCKRASLIVGNVYLPPNTDMEIGTNEIISLSQFLLTKGPNVAICGDHNIDLLKATTHSYMQSFLEQCMESNIPSITKPTRITHSSASLIDNIFLSSCIYDCSHSWIVIEDTSDHLPCLTSIEGLTVDTGAEQFVVKRSLYKKNIGKIQTNLDAINWLHILDDKDCETSLNLFLGTLLETIEQYTPEKKVKRKKSVQP